MFSQCFRNVFAQFSESFRNVFAMFSQCFRNVFVMFPVCFRNVFAMCFRNVFVMCSQCFRNVFAVFPLCFRSVLWFPRATLCTWSRHRSRLYLSQPLLSVICLRQFFLYQLHFKCQPHQCSNKQVKLFPRDNIDPDVQGLLGVSGNALTTYRKTKRNTKLNFKIRFPAGLAWETLTQEALPPPHRIWPIWRGLSNDPVNEYVMNWGARITAISQG